jgi:hypothetical protein
MNLQKTGVKMNEKEDIIQKVSQEIAKNHRKIIDDWCKAYLAQLYEEGHDLEPGSFTLNEQDWEWNSGKSGKRYWFEFGVPVYEKPKINIESKMNDLPTTILKRIECIGRAQEKLDDLFNYDLFDNLSKHDPYWHSHHEPEADRLHDIRCKLSYILDKIAAIMNVLSWEEEDV